MNIELDILRYVKEHKIPMVKVAQAAGMTPQNIKKSIGNNPKGDTITKIANGLGVHPIVFFYDKDEEKATTVGSDEKKEEQVTESAPAYPVHENGLVSKNNSQQMTQTSTFCPHCGKKVRVGVVLLPEE